MCPIKKKILKKNKKLLFLFSCAIIIFNLTSMKGEKYMEYQGKEKSPYYGVLQSAIILTVVPIAVTLFFYWIIGKRPSGGCCGNAEKEYALCGSGYGGEKR